MSSSQEIPRPTENHAQGIKIVYEVANKTVSVLCETRELAENIMIAMGATPASGLYIYERQMFCNIKEPGK